VSIYILNLRRDMGIKKHRVRPIDKIVNASRQNQEPILTLK